MKNSILAIIFTISTITFFTISNKNITKLDSKSKTNTIEPSKTPLSTTALPKINTIIQTKKIASKTNKISTPIKVNKAKKLRPVLAKSTYKVKKTPTLNQKYKSKWLNKNKIASINIEAKNCTISQLCNTKNSSSDISVFGIQINTNSKALPSKLNKGNFNNASPILYLN